MKILYFVIVIAGISELVIARQLKRTKFRIVLFYLSLALVLFDHSAIHLIGFMMLFTLCMSGLVRYRNRNYIFVFIAFTLYVAELFLVGFWWLTILLAVLIVGLVLFMSQKMDRIIRFDYIFYAIFLVTVGPMQYYSVAYSDNMVIVMLTYNFFRATIIIRQQQGNQIENQNFFEAIVKYSPNAIVLTNLNGIMLFVNDAAQVLSGYNAEELLGHKTSVFRSGETPIEMYQDMWRTIKSGDIWQGTLKNRKKGGETYWETLTITPIFNKQGHVEYFLGTKNDTSFDVQRMKNLEEDAHLDDLTGTYRRKYFQHLVFEARQIHTSKNSIVMFDIDDYKSINDNYGHQIGDDILIQISRLLMNAFTNYGYVCRYGGDEFAIFTHDLDQEAIEERIQHVLNQLNTSSLIAHRQAFPICMSYGIHAWDMIETLESAIHQADQSMYIMKRGGSAT